MIGAASAPLASVAEAKAFLRIEHGAEDAEIAAFVESASALCEAFTGQLLIAREVSEVVPVAPGWRRLAGTPVRAILEVGAVLADGSGIALPAGAYAIDIDGNGDGWVRSVGALGGGSRLRVRYRAGLAENWDGVPEPLRHGVLRPAAHLHGHRDDEAGPPAAVTALWRPWRRMRLR